jgi:hypothetical protein
MKNVAKYAVAAGALVVGAWFIDRAEAGNAQVPTAIYFSVKLDPGQYFTYAGADADAVLLVDDVTYSADIDTGGPPARVPFFAEVIPNNPPTNHPIPNLGDFGKAFTRARGAAHYLTLEEENPTPSSTFEVFDRFSHTTHAELFLLHDEITVDRGSTHFEPAGTFRGPNSAHIPQKALVSNRTRAIVHDPVSPPEVTIMDPTSASVMGWATPTSGSRHYQSPQIVQHGNRVWLKNGGTMSYKSGVCYVKGRLVLDANCAPVEVTAGDISVVTP